MNISTEYKISLTQDELNRIAAAHCGFPLDSKIVLTIERPTIDAGDWIDVSQEWKQYHCPTDYPIGTRLDIMFHDGGVTEVDCRAYRDHWVQEGHAWTIIKYRVSKG